MTSPAKAKFWHSTKNGSLLPSDIRENSGKKVWWKCPIADDHEWFTTPDSMSGCPVCSNQKVVKSNCLETTNPSLAGEWDYSKNLTKTPQSVVEGSPRKVWWKCTMGTDHEWRASIVSRSRGSGCPYCTLTPQSRQELTITFELLKFFTDIDPRGFKTRVKGKLKSIDIFIPELNLGIEFDGSYWHKDKRALDKLKTEQLKKEGFEIIRVREEPLRKITDADIVSSTPFNGKQVTDSVLIQIMRLFPIEGRLEARIKKYIAQDSLQNEKALNTYIEKVLEEKAAKEDSKSN
jgi:hypothetical protein